MNTALSLNMTPATPATIAAEADAVALMSTARDLVEAINTTLENTEGAGRTEVAKALAEVLRAVARRIEG